jgi:hypothetical protein
MSGDGDVGPKRIGIDLGQLGRAGAIRPSHERCPGALLLITRYDYDQLVDGGEAFVTPRREMPVDGKADARIDCGNQVMRKASSVGGETVYGLCLSCSGLEADVRQQIREKQGQR